MSVEKWTKLRRWADRRLAMYVVYIAGPFRGSTSWEIEQNIRRAEELALKVWLSDPPMAAICPHTNTRFYSGVGPDEIWLQGDLEIMRRCDAVLLVEGWEGSSGAKREVEEAGRWLIAVFDNIDELRQWNAIEELKP